MNKIYDATGYVQGFKFNVQKLFIVLESIFMAEPIAYHKLLTCSNVQNTSKVCIETLS